MSLEELKSKITTNTKQFLLDLTADNLRMVLTQYTLNQFITNFFNMQQIQKSFSYLPMEKLREMTSSEMSVSDDDVINNINNNFFMYYSKLVQIVFQLTPQEQTDFINKIPNDVVREILKTNSDSAFSSIKDILIYLEPETFKQFATALGYSSQENYEMVQFSWVGIR